MFFVNAVLASQHLFILIVLWVLSCLICEGFTNKNSDMMLKWGTKIVIIIWIIFELWYWGFL